MRKLAIAALAFSAGVFAANYILPLSWLILPAVLLAVGGAALMALRRRWLMGVVIAMLFASIGLLNYYVHYQLTVVKAEALAGETRQLELRLMTYPVEYEDYCSARVQICEGEAAGLKAVLYDNSVSISDAKPGDRLSLSCKLKSADKLYGEDYDYYYSVGVYLKLSSQGKVELTSRDFDLLALPARVSHFLSDKVETSFPADTAQFMKSLMLGDKSGLYKDETLVLAMSRSGFMHIVAVSGMHIAFLVGLLRLLLGASRRSSVVCLVFVWCFTLLTGAGPATVRAAFMQSLLLLASLVYRENDPITSLSGALAMLLLFNPNVASSISLQLSFGAMAGILCFSHRIYGVLTDRINPKLKLRVLQYVLATVSSSLGVMVFILPLMAVHFSSVSLLSPLTNIAGLWAVSLCFCGGWLSCLLACVPVLGYWSAWLCSWLARYIIFVSNWVSSLTFAALYMETRGAWLWLLLSYVVFATAIISKLRPLLKTLLPCLASAVMLVAVLHYNRLDYNSNDTFALIDVGQGQSIAALSGDSTVVIDCGNSFSMDNAGELTGAFLHSCGRDRLDLLVLTHLHRDHANGVTMLMEMVDVDTLVLPKGVNDPDHMLENIIAYAERKGTDIIYVKEEAELLCGDITMELYPPAANGNDNERCLMLKLSMAGFDALITGDGSMSGERELMSAHELSGIDMLVVGHHGSDNSSASDFLDRVAGNYALISTGYNSYGHPGNETLERLTQSGYNILRTDLCGTVEIRIG